MVELAGVDFVNGTLLNATKANETLGAGAGGLRRLAEGGGGAGGQVTVTLRRALQDGETEAATNETCVQSQVYLQNGSSLGGVLCGNETAATYEFQPEAMDYFRRGRRTMVRPRMEAIPVRASPSSGLSPNNRSHRSRAPPPRGTADNRPRHRARQARVVEVGPRHSVGVRVRHHADARPRRAGAGALGDGVRPAGGRLVDAGDDGPRQHLNAVSPPPPRRSCQEECAAHAPRSRRGRASIYGGEVRRHVRRPACRPAEADTHPPVRRTSTSRPRTWTYGPPRQSPAGPRTTAVCS